MGEKRRAVSAHLRRSNVIQYSGNHTRSSNNDNSNNVIQQHPNRSWTATGAWFLAMSSSSSPHRVLQDGGGGGGGGGGNNNNNGGGGSAPGPGPGGAAFVESMLFFGFMFALAFLVWTLLRFGCNVFRTDRQTRTAEEELRLRGLPAPPGGTTSRVNGNASSSNAGGGTLILSRRTQELTAAQKRERRAFLENVLLNEPYAAVDSGGDLPSTTRTTPNSNACAICLEEYQKGDRITKSFNSRCNHVFHRHCALQWFLSLQGNDDACPCCRQNFLQFDDDDDNNNEGHNNYTENYATSDITAGLGENGDSTAVAAISPSASFAAESRAAFPAQQLHTPPPMEQQFAPPPQQRRVVDEAVYLQALHDLVDEETSVVATTTTTTPTTGIAAAAEPVGAAVNAGQGVGHNYSHGPVATAEGVSISGQDNHNNSIPRSTKNKSTLFGDETHQRSDFDLPGGGSE